MLARVYRLNRARDIGRVLRNGRFVRARTMNLKYCANREQKKRFGIVVSGKVSKKATVRNKIKRQLRELIRATIHNFPPNIDYLFLLHHGPTLPTRADLDRDLQHFSYLLSHTR